MFIWFILAVALIVIAATGFAGRRRYQRTQRHGSKASAHGKQTHHGKNARNHRGRGRGH